MTSSAAGSMRQAHLHQQMYLCLKAGALFQRAADVLNQPGEVFPRSYASSIRLLAGQQGQNKTDGDGQTRTDRDQRESE
ncbi:hypothetical protein AK812_SmicGene33564 [Symbiodinium microadriaticum]|uniref:Uncharacterized protein n=1 Tax=Symbiodinium microadriaticum TaxID=2951 RepID=A0A1Q9CR74_SYMMI|nr:hypothetical protein AK812_SmicGene33564 [Symbiodinium microadriaticum]